MAQFHFVEDYEKYVASLIATHPIDEAMSLAVGGRFDEVGQIEVNILRYFGLRDGMSVLDADCGSGQLSNAMTRTRELDYCGTDLVQSLLDYAATKSASNYRFKLNPAISVPVEDQSTDLL